MGWLRLLVFLSASLCSIIATAAVYTQTNPTAASIRYISGPTSASDSFPVTIGGAGESVSDVTVTVIFGQTNASSSFSCTTFSGSAFANENAYRLQSPAGTSVALFENFEGNASGGGTGNHTFSDTGSTPLDTAITFDDNAAELVGEEVPDIPITGTFRPIQALALFAGEDPSGDWILTGYNDDGDALCHQSFSLTVTTLSDAPTSAAIPTISVWGLGILIVLMMGIGFSRFRKI